MARNLSAELAKAGHVHVHTNARVRADEEAEVGAGAESDRKEAAGAYRILPEVGVEGTVLAEKPQHPWTRLAAAVAVGRLKLAQAAAAWGVEEEGPPQMTRFQVHVARRPTCPINHPPHPLPWEAELIQGVPVPPRTRRERRPVPKRKGWVRASANRRRRGQIDTLPHRNCRPMMTTARTLLWRP
jgi:hypothetical protein